MAFWRIVIGMGVSLLFAAGTAYAAAAACFDDWGTAGEIVRKEGLITVEQLAADRRADALGDIVKATLCMDGEAYVYRLVVRDKAGQLKSVIVQAKSPGAAATDR